MGLHDKLFKQIFSQKSEMEELIIHMFPEQIVEHLDIKTLEKDNTTYIDENLKENFADIVYTCLYFGKIKIKIVFLFEHKSDVIEYPHPQLLTYILKIWEISLKETKKRTFVLPIIFYHGNKAWVKHELNKYFEDIDDNLRKYIPSFDYVLIDISKLPDEKIEEYFKLQTLRITVYLMKYIFDVPALKQKISQILSTLPELVKDEKGEKFFVTLYYYLSNFLNMNDMETVKEKIDVIYPQGNDLLEIYNKELITKGIEKDKKEIAIKMIKKGYDNELIADLTNLTIGQIEKIRNELLELTENEKCLF